MYRVHNGLCSLLRAISTIVFKARLSKRTDSSINPGRDRSYIVPFAYNVIRFSIKNYYREVRPGLGSSV